MNWWQWAILFAACITLGAMVMHARRRWSAQHDEEREQRRQVEAELRERGEMLPDGTAACVICRKVPATELWPCIRRSRLDNDPWGHRRLNAQPAMYTIALRKDLPAQVCKPHQRMVMGKLEQVLGERRARSAQFASHEEQLLALWEGGQLLVWGRSEFEQQNASLRDLRHAGYKVLPESATSTPLAGNVTLHPEPEGEGGADE